MTKTTTALLILLALTACSAQATRSDHPEKFGPHSSQKASDSDEAISRPGTGLPN